ncbi:SDR family NAD(P)-dependent oxidoreductase [Leptolyngbyaceae cyanobacterium CCMR0082]|uniref:SDR family NAD(P)-dependent oxidoreductase n=2 Tax=Adonisia TaxID=2950183 RepID=A0A6M0SA34_9CYAN|nr:SDR family NAD(P)-dependent oxidoreductase [Adonisia turfae CCMR0082]
MEQMSSFRLDITQEFETIERRIAELLAGIFDAYGFFREQRFTLEELKARVLFKPAYDRWLAESLAALHQWGLLGCRDGGHYTVPDTECPPLHQLWDQWRHARAQAGRDNQARWQLAEICLRALPDMLAGRQRATDVIFPDASMALVEHLYQGNAVADLFNGLMADALVQILGARLTTDETQTVRILEIGAGTGGTTVEVLKKLQPFKHGIAEYLYTDISQFFLLHARERYAPGHPYLRTALFDVESPPESQGIEPGRYDFVIATNILHATKNIRHTLRHVKTAMRCNGILLINEVKDKTLWGHVTFGLLEGWWRPEDKALRIPGSPLLASETWRRVLADEGFDPVVFPGQWAHGLGQQVILAASDGWVRQSILETANHQPPVPINSNGRGGGAEVSLRSQAVAYFKQLMAATLKLRVDEIAATEPLESYGIDSILINRVNAKLRANFGDVRSTLLFEAQTIDALADHFIHHQRPALERVLRAKSSPSQAVMPVVSAPGLAGTETTVSAERHRPQSESQSEGQSDGPALASEIAIIGISGHYAQADNLDTFWKNLEAGHHCVTEIPADRWSLDGFFEADMEKAVKQTKSYSKWGSFLPGFADFDPLFFGIPPSEAMKMDPQERLFLQATWEALEDAGHTRTMLADQYGGRVGVFVGISRTGFELFGADFQARGGRFQPRTSFSSAANRVSYFLNIHGPSMPIDTMCSSSLTAIHEACEHLRRGTCDLVIAGGVNLFLHPSSYVELCASGMLSQDGKCKSFGAGGDGFVPGEGVGAVVLKPLQRAIADGDNIHAVIRGSSVNHGGKTNGYTVPNPLAQRDLIQVALAQAGVHARSMSYIEAHGTGTELGDPIEITGLSLAFESDTDDTGFCAIGSVKSNLGHLEAAAGIAGLTKVVLQLKHGRLAPSLHATALNPNISFEKTPFYVQRQAGPWPRPELALQGESRQYPRLAGVSSFGAGGTNAHVVLEEFQQVQRPQTAGLADAGQPAVIVLSAKNEAGLQRSARQLLAYLEKMPEIDAQWLHDAAFSLQVGREAMAERLGCVVSSGDELIDQLRRFVRNGSDEHRLHRGQMGGHRDALAFSGDDDLRDVVAAWIQHRKYDKLLSLWVWGGEFDWHRLHAPGTRRRVSLPTYPFDCDRYWFDRDITSPSPTPSASTLMMVPQWQPRPLMASQGQWTQHYILLCDLGECSPDAWAGFQARGITCHLMESQADQIHGRFADYAAQLLDLLRTLLRDRSATTLIQLVVPTGGEAQLHSGLSGMLKTAYQENPNLHGQVIEVDPSEGMAAIGERLIQDSHCPGDTHIRYGHGKRLVQTWQELAMTDAVTPPWRDNGVYLISGGAGGLGLLFAREIATQAQDVTLILTGRSDLSDGQRESLRQLEADVAVRGARLDYCQTDVCDRASVDRLAHHIQTQFGRLDGILHAAGLVRDSFILKKNPADLRDVLAPKVSGTVNLAAAFAALAPEVFLLFSSVSGVMGNPGQADYAAANGFMNAWAEHCRQALSAELARKLPQLAGKLPQRTVALCWPLWQQGGMGLDVATADALEQDTGMMAMPVAAGMDACYRALAANQAQVMIAYGDAARLRRTFLRPKPLGESESRRSRLPHLARHARERLWQRTLGQLVQLFGEVIQLHPDRIDVQASMEDFGVDSIIVTQMNQKLAPVFQKFPKTLFFEYPTLASLCSYFVDTFPAECASWTGLSLASPLSSQPMATGLAGRPDPSPAQDSNDSHNSRPPEARGQQVSRGSGRKPSPTAQEPIAIIGLSARFPQAETLDAFWSMLRSGTHVVTEIPSERWPLAGFYEPDPKQAVAQGKSYGKWGAFLEGFADFDPLFFNLSPQEALRMDPQERLFLQTSWSALEDAGYTPARLAQCCDRNVGVFAGITKTGYDLYGPELWQMGDTLQPRTSFASVANRVSFLLNLKGPSMPVDTMCSSSLTAIHEACQRLRLGDCAMALAGGVNLYLHPANYVELSTLQMLSKDGRCRSFGNGGDGFVPGEGVAVVLLKPLVNAVADGDQIHAVIRGSRVNHGGRTNGYTVPNPKAQADLIRRTLDQAGVDARTVSYVEAHGTGTSLGDPIEVEGLTQAFRADTSATGFCALGSVKSNLGHLEAAAGIAGLVKILLQMRHRQLVPSLHAAELNPHIEFDDTPFQLQQTLADWPRPTVGVNDAIQEAPRIACLSSFGAGGSNAHVVVEEYPGGLAATDAPSPIRATPQPVGPVGIALSAKTQERLQVYAKRLKDFLVDHRSALDGRLQDIAYTLQLGRVAMDERLAMAVSTLDELLDNLDGFLQGRNRGANCFQGRRGRDRTPLALISNDEDFGETVDRWMQRGKLSKLLELWTQGLSIDWTRLYQATPPGIVSLPTYPFARERYWLPELKRSKPAVHDIAVHDTAIHKTVAKELDAQTVTEWTLHPVWDGVCPKAVERFPDGNAAIAIIGGTLDQLRAVRQEYPSAQPLELPNTADLDPWSAVLDRLPGLAHILWIAPETEPLSLVDDRVIEAQDIGVIQLFRLVKALLSLGYGQKTLGWTVITDQAQAVLQTEPIHPIHAGIHGFVGSMAKEFPQWQVRLLDLDAQPWPDDLWTIPPNPQGEALAYRGNQWFQQALIPVQDLAVNPEPFRTQGTYIIIGGAGGLGEVLSRHLIQHWQAQVIWVGRRPLNPDIQTKIDALAALGAAPWYLSADAANVSDLERVRNAVQQKYGSIHGVVHSALGSYDQSLMAMDEAQFRSVLSSKVDITVRVAQVFADAPLDVILFFSSLASFGKVRGMSSYAAGCVFQDAFALGLSQICSIPVKVINWGFWSIGGGARISDTLRRHLQETEGVQPINADVGMGVLEQCISSNLSPWAFIKSDASRPPRGVVLDQTIAQAPRVVPSCLPTLADFSPAIAVPAVHPLLAELDVWMVKLLLAQFLQMGVLQNGVIENSATLRQRTGVLAKYQIWWDEVMAAFGQQGWVHLNNGTITVEDAALLENPELIWRQWQAFCQQTDQDDEMRPLTAIIDECFRALPAIVRGHTLITDILFPAGAVNKMEVLYKDNSIAHFFNTALAEVAAAWLQQRLDVDPQAQIRILEIGAGTGGTTSTVLPHLAPFKQAIATYCYTDISNSFLMDAAQRYGATHPYLEYKICDIEQPLAAQGLEVGTYDLVIATNVLHATHSMGNTVRNAKAALAENGVLLLNEMTAKTVFATLIFGLIDGWSLAQDTHLRIPGSPGLTPAAWRQLLAETGFKHIQLPVPSAQPLAQQIIVAESDGVIRQKRSQVAPEPIASVVVEHDQPTESHTEPTIDKSAYVQQQIVACLSRTLRLDDSRFELDVSFSDYGVDSILGAQFITLVSAALDIDLNTTIIFNYPTVERLSAHVLEAYGDRITPPAPDRAPELETPGAQEPLGGQTTPASSPGQAPRSRPQTTPTVSQSPSTSPAATDIAVIGLSLQVPGAQTPPDFWQHLLSGQNAVSELPAHYLDRETYYSPQRQKGKTYCHQGGVLKDRDCFDPLFFNLSPRDAESMNPHQRLIMQEGWKALEDAGYNPKSLAGVQTGIFVGSEPNGYFHETFTGASEAIIASRLSYFLNLRGPALVVNTGCSSAATALHLACESLRNGECSMALAGGVYASMNQAHLISLSEIEMLSPSGCCRTFDAEGDGMVLSEGVGMVTLKRLADAERDGDPIYGVIAASGLNQDGASNGITAPSGVAQEELITDVYQRYGINPEDISYVEAHGTGTRLGDPVEANALTRAFRRFTNRQHYCALGSAKAHIGHTAAGAGIIGLIKVLLSLQHRKLPGLPHFETLNPRIEFDHAPFFIPAQTTDWSRDDGKPLMAALSSFGHSGTNVHFVIREYQPPLWAPTDESVQMPSNPAIVPLSAKDERRLRQVVQQLRGYLRDTPRAAGPGTLRNLAYTLQTGREAMNCRMALVVHNLAELQQALTDWLADGASGRTDGSLAANSPDQLSQWLAEERFEAIADYWSQGGSVDWQRLYGDRKPVRIHLPTYPFAKERYWANGATQTGMGAAPVLAATAPTPLDGADTSDYLLASPAWQTVPVPSRVSMPEGMQRLIILCAETTTAIERSCERLATANASVIRLDRYSTPLDTAYTDFSLQVFQHVRNRLQSHGRTKTLVQVVIPDDAEASVLLGIAGLLHTAQQENPKLEGQVIALDVSDTDQGLLTKIEANARCAQDILIRYENGVRQVIRWHELSPGDLPASGLPWKDQGIYLITGGAGGIGLIFASEIASRVNQATLVLIGRSPLTPEKEARLNEIAQNGTRIDYRQVDISQPQQVQALILDIQANHGPLNGVIHAAGIHRDNYLIHKPDDEFRAVLAPKVQGTVNLDQSLAATPLDFFALFSSGAAVTGNLGQADYAAANGFMDQFATHRQRLVAAGQRFGQTLSINWPLWQQGGMQVDAATVALMHQRTGMKAMPTTIGIQAFYQALMAKHPQVGVVTGDLATIRQRLFGTPHKAETVRQTGPIDQQALRAATLQQLKQLLGARLKLSPERIASQEPFERYGIDSILITDLNQDLEAVFGEISKTLFFEYQTLSALTDYFVADHPEDCQRWCGLGGKSSGNPTPAVSAAVPTALAAGAIKATGGPRQEPIAIIGISGHYPQADSLAAFWSNLSVGQDGVTEIPPERWSLEGFYLEQPEEAVAQAMSYGKWGGFLDGFAEFDPQFFNISGREAMSMDPQERLFLQSAWAALEDAGYTRETLQSRFDGNVGVFAGITKTGYDLHGAEWRQHGKLFYPHTSFGSVANRVSYLLNLHGPSMPIDTMCSSSLVAIHEACERLRQGVCPMAIAGGVNLYLHPTNYVELSALKMLSKGGKCRSFGEGGDGFVPGEGVGVVILKPLAQALQDRDHIHGVIRATAVNHGGKTNGYTVPNPKAQAELIRKTLDLAGIHARTVSYVEAHGTGTALGDPIEVTGLTQAFYHDTTDVGFCALGSVKSNIGHLEAAAGMAGLTKILLQMKHGKLAPSLHADRLNPNISFENTPFQVQRSLADWPRPQVNVDGTPREYPRIAGLSSFGAGGANAHVILEEYMDETIHPPQADADNPPAVFVLSAKNEDRLRDYARAMRDHLQTHISANQLPDFLYTLQVGREAMDQRLAMVVHSQSELVANLSLFIDGQPLGKDCCRGQVDHEQEISTGAATTINLSSLDPTRLAQAWVQGHPVNWHQRYRTRPPRRLAAPTYPFARERYWIAPGELSGDGDRPILTHAVSRPTPTGFSTPPLQKIQRVLAQAPGNQMNFVSPAAKPKNLLLRNLSVPVAPDLQDMATSPLSNSPEPQLSEGTLIRSLKRSLAKALFIDEGAIAINQPYIDMGLDSIVGVEWVHAINKEFGLSLSATRVYDFPTIRQLATYLRQALADTTQATEPATPRVANSDGATANSDGATANSDGPVSEAPISNGLAPTSTPTSTVQEPAHGFTTAQLETFLVTSLAKALFIEPKAIDPKKPFVDFGLDSIVGVEWVHAINTEFGVNLSATRVYDYPTIQALAEHLKNILPVPPTVPPPAPASLSSPSPPEQPLETSVASRDRQPSSPPPPEPIAVVGMSGRYPQAKDLEQFWQNLAVGQNSIREIPRDRWNVDAYFDPNPSTPGKIYCKWLGALDEVDCFDPLFFGISPAEAEGMDPQHRLFLEEGYRAFEDAGYGPRLLSNVNCGVYMGVMSYEYAFLLQQRQAELTNTGNSFAIGAARIPYFLNLKGPAIPVDTACSSSLVAIHLACQALRQREIDMALAGGVSLYLIPESYVGMCAAGMVSPDGQCKAFDDDANGFVPGEGAGSVVLKRLADAERDGDHIYGLIIASGINQDGKTNGITAPSAQRQIDLLQSIYTTYGIDPSTISYVETHGTGTRLGDPIELEALTTAFRQSTDGQQFCALGSVKSNIGHTSAAAGVAGVQKTLLAMQHQQLPASLHFKKPNRHFKFAESPFYVNTELKAWPTEPSSPRRAAVSAFGFSGTNAHLVLEDYVGPPSASPAPSGPSPVVIVLSARRVDQLQTVVRQLHDHLIATETPDAIELPSLAYTLQVGRAELEERLAFIVDSMDELIQALQGFLADAPGHARYFRGQVNPHDETVQALVDDDAFIETVDQWMQQGNLDSVLQLWVKGLDVDWHCLYGSARPRRISLPTYPFARHRCWVDAVAENPGGSITLPQSSATQRPLLSPLQLPTLTLKDLDPLGVARDFVPAALEDLLAQLLWGILQAMGLFQRGSFDLSAAMAAGKIRQGYERWLQAALQDFVRRGQLDYSAGKFVTPDAHPPSLTSLWTLWDLQQQIESRDPLKQAQFPLIEACLRSLPEILQGDRTAVEVMFPDASLELVEPFYQGNPVSDLFNEILSRTLTSCIEQRIAADPEARIRILEIGAGTGGMTAAVLPCLKAFGQHVVEYCHTDISKSFQFHAEEQFVPDYPFVRAQLFDVERPPTEQGVAQGQYDFVIASNVLHATRNIRRTVGHARSVLRSNGLLLINEISRKSLLGHLTFGLLDGWWLNEDNELRIPGSPALYPETWEKVLREEGFASVVFPCGESHELGQQILAASLGTPQNISGKKEFLACQEDWGAAPLEKEFLTCQEDWYAAPIEVADWTPRIDAVKTNEVLVISAKLEDADAITKVCETVARLAEYPANTWTVRHLSLDIHGLDETLLAAIVRRDVTQPLTIFLCVPPIVDDGIDQLAQVFATVQSVMRVMHARSTHFYCCYTEPAAAHWLYGEALAGLFKSAMAESVNHRYRVVSHDAASAIDGRTALRIVQEWLCDETQELPVAMVPMVRYEQGQRYELRATESMPPADDRNVFRQGATYLMVGALGPAGLQVCEELGRRYQARLVLFSRRGEHQAEAALNRIRAAGATVLYRSVDIVDQTALEQAMASVKAEGVTLNGVIHMARRVADAPIVQKNFHDFVEVMAAKVMGGLNLDAVTADEPLDFFLMYSSMAAFGIQGSPDYAFSAAYQNALARFRDQQVSQGRRSGRTRSICWGQWDVDGVVSTEQLPKRLERLRGIGMDAIDAASAMALMQASVRDDTSVVGFMAVFDRERVRRTLGLGADSHVSEDAIANGIKAYEHQQWTDLDLARFLDSVPDQDLTDSIQAEIIRVIRAADSFSRPAERSAGKKRNSNGARIDTGQQPSNSPIQVAISPKPASKDSDPLRAAILASIKKTLKIPESELDWNHPLQDYGLDSIIAMQLATTLEKHLNCPVQPRWLIEYPTLNLLMEKLNKEVKDNPSN